MWNKATGGPRLSLKPSTLTIPLAGRPDSYPLDWQSNACVVTVLYPSHLTHVRRTAGRLEIVPSILVPTQVRVHAAPSLAGFAVKTNGPRDAHPPVVAAQPELRFTVERTPSTKLFVFIVLATPLLLAFGVGLALLTSGRIRSGESHELLVGMATATIALLPLRVVLVPGDLQSPTLVDWCLGAELLVFAAVGLIGLGRTD
jgi:hypothetical protein